MKFRTAYGERERVGLQNNKPSMTKQSFKDECDINNIMKKWQKTGVVTHTKKYNGQYADFSNVKDYHSAMNAVIEAHSMFYELPSSMRLRFDNDPGAFLAFVENPSNKEELIALGLAVRDSGSDLTPPAASDTAENKTALESASK